MFILLVNSHDQPLLARYRLYGLPGPDAPCSKAVLQEASFIMANLEPMPLCLYICGDLTHLEGLHTVQNTLTAERLSLLFLCFPPHGHVWLVEGNGPGW